MKTKLQKDNKGFTIIEVLIVLAIAGLILLIVFLAVPALQRNSRNTQAKNDASSILSAVSEYTNNNNGKAPTVSQSATDDTDAQKILANAKLNKVEALDIVAQADEAPAATDTKAFIVLGAKCSAPSGNDLTTPAATSARSIVIVYQIENSSGPLLACQES